MFNPVSQSSKEEEDLSYSFFFGYIIISWWYYDHQLARLAFLVHNLGFVNTPEYLKVCFYCSQTIVWYWSFINMHVKCTTWTYDCCLFVCLKKKTFMPPIYASSIIAMHTQVISFLNYLLWSHAYTSLKSIPFMPNWLVKFGYAPTRQALIASH